MFRVKTVASTISLKPVKSWNKCLDRQQYLCSCILESSWKYMGICWHIPKKSDSILPKIRASR